MFPARKTFHFKNLKSITNLEYSDFLFFDDEYKNIDICTNLGKYEHGICRHVYIYIAFYCVFIGVASCLVDCNKGLDGITLVKGLRSYVAKDAILFKLPSYIIAEKRFYLKLNNKAIYMP